MAIPTISVADGPPCCFAATSSGTSAGLFDSDSSLTWRPESTRTVTVQDPSEAVHVAVSGALSPGWSPGTEIGLLIASPEGLETLMRTEKAPAAAVPPFSTEKENVTVSPAVTLDGLTARLDTHTARSGEGSVATTIYQSSDQTIV